MDGGAISSKQAARRWRHLPLDGAQQSAAARGGFQFGEALESGGERRERTLDGGSVQRRHGTMLRGEADARLEGRDFVEIGEARQARFHRFVCQEDAGLLRVGRRAAGFDRDLIEHQRRDGFHTLAAAIPFESGDFAEAIGEQVEQPLGLDGAGQAHHGSSLIFPIFGFHGHEKVGAGDRAVGRLLRGSAARQLQFRALTPPRHAIGKAGQDAQQEGIFAFRRAGGRARARASQLAEQPRGVGRPLRFQEHQQVGARGVRRARRQAVPGAEQCGQRTAVAEPHRDAALPPVGGSIVDATESAPFPGRCCR